MKPGHSLLMRLAGVKNKFGSLNSDLEKVAILTTRCAENKQIEPDAFYPCGYYEDL